MMRQVLVLMILLNLLLYANDGAYTLSGNQLIPIDESNISIKKEVLTIRRLDDEDDTLDVTVEYTFFNPSSEKTIVVGFEAAEPSGDVTTKPKNGGHPYMKSFSVLMNDKKIPYKIKREIANEENEMFDESEEYKLPIGYVYHFKAPFKKGLNHITHHYTYASSGGVSSYFKIDYVLTAAKRWAGKQIEDFTLVIDVGEYVEFQILKSFFNKSSEWKFDGMAKDIVGNFYSPYDKDKTKYSKFYLKKSPLVFRKKNFKIDGDLTLVSLVGRYGLGGIEEFDYKKYKLPFRSDIYNINEIFSRDRMSYKILNNLPYARRGYIFKNSLLQKYYESLEWYRKDINYKASATHLISAEREWFTQLNESTLKILQNIPYAKRGYIFKNEMLDSYFSQCKWYKENKHYKSSFTSLTKEEQLWLLKVKKMKKDRGVDFYGLMDEYDTMYDNCLHKHEKDKVHNFMKRLILLDKKQIKSRFSKKDTRRIDEDLIDDLFLEITVETLDNYKKGYSDEENTFQIKLFEDEKRQGCYEYLYSHGFEARDDEYGFFIGIAKENGAFKIVRLNMAG